MTAERGDDLSAWVGRTEEAEEVVSPGLVARYRATFDLPDEHAQASVPYGFHWCLSPRIAMTRDLDGDGHARRGGFLPQVDLPRRMWAGGEVAIHRDVSIGDRVRRHSRIADVAMKSGRSGELCFVTVEHELSVADEVVITERQDIVYREAHRASAAQQESMPASPGRWTRRTTIGPAMLFRYSALTFNAHRIHYDYPYAVEQEGYGGLVVHGPLQAALLMEFFREISGTYPRNFSFRGMLPLLAGDLSLNAADGGDGRLSMWVADRESTRTLTAEARSTAGAAVAAEQRPSGAAHEAERSRPETGPSQIPKTLARDGT